MSEVCENDSLPVFNKETTYLLTYLLFKRYRLRQYACNQEAKGELRYSETISIFPDRLFTFIIVRVGAVQYWCNRRVKPGMTSEQAGR